MSKTKQRVVRTKIPKKQKIAEKTNKYKNFKQFLEEEAVEDNIQYKIKGLK